MVSDKQHQVTEKAMGAAVDDIQDQSALNEEVNARLVNDSESREAAGSLYSTSSPDDRERTDRYFT
jgi:hypothetical protein